LRDRGDALVVPGLGAPTWDAAAAGDHPLTFQMWGAMGGTAMIALGLALAQPNRRVIALPGDGDMLMGVGSLATIGTQGPANIVVAVIDNERYGETGMQETHTARGVDLEGIARSSGFGKTATVYTKEELEAAMPLIYGQPGPVFLNIKVTTDPVPNVLPPRDGAWLKHRFRQALLGDKAFE
jgi:thiamine pyrophosphate-dependent acetolactate synthase large subunit-like protein